MNAAVEQFQNKPRRGFVKFNTRPCSSSLLQLEEMYHIKESIAQPSILIGSQLACDSIVKSSRKTFEKLAVRI